MKMIRILLMVIVAIILTGCMTGCGTVQKNKVLKKNNIVKICADGSRLEDHSVLIDNSTSFAVAGTPKTRQYANSAAVGTEESRPGFFSRLGSGILGTLSGPPFPNSYSYYPSYGYSSLPGATYVNPGPSVYRTYSDQYSRPPGAVYIKPGPSVYNHPGYPGLQHNNQHRGPWQR